MAQPKGLAAVDLEAKRADLLDINSMHAAFGDGVYPVLRKQYLGLGYQAGVERMTRLVAAGHFDPQAFLTDPVAGVQNWLQGYFDDRSAAMPEIWSEGNIVHLMTRACRKCLTLDAEKQTPVNHREVCFIYCRAWAEGYVDLLTDLFPGLIVNYYNKDSRREGSGHDCVEAFQVISPR